MGTKLIFCLVIFNIATMSCSSIHRYSKNDFFVREDDYVKAYKTAVMCGCLNEGTNGNFYKFLEDNKDLGLFTEGDLISHHKVNEASNLGKLYAQKIEPFNYGDGKGKIPNFSRCFLYALSKEVDSIAKKNYWIMLKQK